MTTTPDEDDGLWVRSDVLPDGTYGVAVTVGPDCAFHLDRAQALEYAATCMSRATEAEHAVAVIRLLTERLKLGEDAAKTVVMRDLRQQLVGDHDTTAPLRLVPAIGRNLNPASPNRFTPIVVIELGGEQLGVLEPDAVRDHGEGVLNTMAGAVLDDRLFRYLTERIDLPADKARAVVAGLSEYLPIDNDTERQAQ
ncbi:hypothetical protein SAMN05421837_107400 [Amycolatopsis pretoriensis]|uniref:Uncharacterized protein n=1 Tax=Amycolatopsis pretoriensis TaxID=218821 RepID=A0A1H5R8R6_9PSEU|nr:hypothetical protein [Amycolatopsis pretoriensis]SEF34464.1 hypothetical protein SAMN05421837_107400 [Amycolatopsis pretoriensis]